VITIEFGPKDKSDTSDNKMETFFINGKPIDIENNLRYSKINFSCSSRDANGQCTNAVFDLFLFVSTTSKTAKFGTPLTKKYAEAKRDGKPLPLEDGDDQGDKGWIELESQFGF